VIASTGGARFGRPPDRICSTGFAPNRWRMDAVRIPFEGGSKVNLTKDVTVAAWRGFGAKRLLKTRQ